LDKVGSSSDVVSGFDVVAKEPVEILLNLAQRGEIDPWNIDIIQVTDRFLQEVRELEGMDLRVSGRTLLYASILLKMKSDALVEDERCEEEEADFLDDFEDVSVEDFPVPRPLLRRRPRRPVTLEELICELKKAEVVEQRRMKRREEDREDVRSRVTTEEVLEIAHEENLEERIDVLSRLLGGVLRERTFLTFSELRGLEKGSSPVMTYISLLFLANRREIRLEQEELFSELYILPSKRGG